MKNGSPGAQVLPAAEPPANRVEARQRSAAANHLDELRRGTPEDCGISVVLIANNEARRIRGCLHSGRWAQQLIVVDQYSTDGTADICRAPGATVFSRKVLAGFGEQKTFAITQATCP